MATFLLILVGIATVIFLLNVVRMPSRYGRSYQMGQQIAEDHPGLSGKELARVQNMHAKQFSDDASVNGFYAGYTGQEYNEEGYDPDQDQEESETIEEHLSFWQKANRK
jgi:hypothetical protein